MSENKLSVTVNNETKDVPDTISTVTELLEAFDYNADTISLYLQDGDDDIGPLGEMLVFDEGDEFTAIPEHCMGG